MLGQKSCRPEVPQMFRFFSPNFAPNFPRFFERFSCFVSCETETRKTHQKSPPFFNAKFPGKFEDKIHKSFLESGQSKNVRNMAEKWERSTPKWGFISVGKFCTGVGADGVGVKFPISAVNCCCLPLSFRRSREKRRKRGKMRRKRGKMRRKRGKSLRPHLIKNLPIRARQPIFRPGLWAWQLAVCYYPIRRGEGAGLLKPTTMRERHGLKILNSLRLEDVQRAHPERAQGKIL